MLFMVVTHFLCKSYIFSVSLRFLVLVPNFECQSQIFSFRPTILVLVPNFLCYSKILSICLKLLVFFPHAWCQSQILSVSPKSSVLFMLVPHFLCKSHISGVSPTFLMSALHFSVCLKDLYKERNFVFNIVTSIFLQKYSQTSWRENFYSQKNKTKTWKYSKIKAQKLTFLGEGVNVYFNCNSNSQAKCWWCQKIQRWPISLICI